jgi:hypothetical protein
VTSHSIDLLRLPNDHQVSAMTTRRSRLAKMVQSIQQAQDAFGTLTVSRSTSTPPLRIRWGFVYREDPAPSSGSDRNVPSREHRPPATRISSSRGAALRLELIALAAAQARYRAGARPSNQLPLRPKASAAQPIGWVDLLASSAEARGKGRTRMGVLDKKLRNVQGALQTLEAAQLVELPYAGSAAGMYEYFQLLDERGSRMVGAPLRYEVPMAREARVFQLPAAFVTEGWVHVLEDSEITLLLMVACGLGRNPGEENVAIAADIRLLHYGISRDAFGAHVMLSKLGLLDVEEVGRHDSGKAVDYKTDGAKLHRLRLLPAGFQQPALPTLTAAIENELNRVGPTIP